MKPHWHPVLVKALVQCLQDTFEGGFYADKVLERSFKKNKKWGSRDRRFLAETLYDMVRWWSRLAAYDCGGFTLSKPEEYAKRWVFYEAWRHGVDAIEISRKAFPNSVPDTDFSAVQNQIQNTKLSREEEYSFPQWLAEELDREGGGDAADLMRALNEPAPVCLRANTLKVNRDELRKRLLAEGIETEPTPGSADGLILPVRQNVFATKAFKDGLFEMQDEASQMIAPLLSPLPGERIADVCAGAGGKTMHLAAIMENKGTLVAGDISERKLEELKKRARRAGVSNLRVQIFENSKSVKKHAGKFDGVLIDAPCSGTGVIRRNCDTKWKLKPSELERLRALQLEILESYSRLVRPGGRLVYATCSVLSSENEKQIDDFLNKHPEFSRAGEPLKTRPDRKGHDGFFAQKLNRSSE